MPAGSELGRIALVLERDGWQAGVADMLRHGGYACEDIRSLPASRLREAAEAFDLVVVVKDRGADAARRAGCVRPGVAKRTPVIVVCDAASDDEIARELDAGADDVLVQPSATILFARVRAILRRCSLAAGRRDEWDVACYSVDAVKRSIRVRGESVQLSRREFDLAAFLLANPGRKLSRDHINQAIWERDLSVLGRSLDTHISRIRAKLRLEPANGVRLTALYGYGYQLELLDRDLGAHG